MHVSGTGLRMLGNHALTMRVNLKWAVFRVITSTYARKSHITPKSVELTQSSVVWYLCKMEYMPRAQAGDTNSDTFICIYERQFQAGMASVRLHRAR